MCFFPKVNRNTESIAYQKGVTHFNCGVCPECLKRKSSYWSLRCCAEAKQSTAIMVTLTYDTYIYDKSGNVIGERVVDEMLSKRDCQLFIKRVRRYFDYRGHDKKIKYLITAERGKRTNRPHYHAILFNVDFDDLVFYKKSKRGNTIYKSATLNKLWNNGICTVDSVCCSSAIARYCTKYLHKDLGTDDCFMLYSHGIGDEVLLKEFNGKSYTVEGVEYPIPRSIFRKYFKKSVDNFNSNLFNTLCGMSFYYYFSTSLGQAFDFKDILYQFNIRKLDGRYRKTKDTKYLLPTAIFPTVHLVDNSKIRFLEDTQRKNYLAWKDKQDIYQKYIAYWQYRSAMLSEVPTLEKVIGLPDDKYFIYKNKCLDYLAGKTCFIPRSSRKVKERAFEKRFSKYGMLFGVNGSCLFTPNDTNTIQVERDKKYVDCNGEFRVEIIRDKAGRFLHKNPKKIKKNIFYKKLLTL